MQFFTFAIFISILGSGNVESMHKAAPRRKPIFTEHPKDAYAVRKRSFSLHCQADGEPPPYIVWYKDEKQVESLRDKPGTSRKMIKLDELLFLSFVEEDEGIYYCNASNSEGWAKSKVAHVQLAFLDPIKEGPENEATSVGDEVLLRCGIPNGIPEPEIEWIHNGERVNYSKRVYLKDGNLRLTDIQQHDGGTYQCKVRNSAEKRESSIAILTVHQKPRFEVTPSNQQVKAGEDVEFHCRVNGDPKPTILWKRDDGLKVPEGRSKLNDDKSLRILQVHPDDEGIYICQARNTIGSVDASAKLLVLSRPSFTLTPEDTTVLEGEKAVFHCHAAGSPAPYLRWVHNGEYFLPPEYINEPNTDRGRIYVTRDGSLIVSSARKSDEGKYECRASHKTGMVRSSANLLVNDFNRLPIVIIDLGPQNQTVLVGTTATLHCKAHVLEFSAPPNLNSDTFQQNAFGVSISWLKNDKLLTADGDPRIVVLPQGTLQINDIHFSDAGSYICRADISHVSLHQQQFAHTEWTAKLDVSRTTTLENLSATSFDALPRPPTSVDIRDVGDSWVTLRCTVTSSSTDIDPSHLKNPGQSQPSETRVRVEYLALDGSHGWVIAAEDNPEQIIRIGGLSSESGYRILVRTMDNRGIGRPFVLPHTVYTKRKVRYVEFQYHTLEDSVRSITLSSLHITGLSTSEIHVSGRICGQPVAVKLLTGLKFRYKQVPLARCLSKEFDSSHNRLSYSVSNNNYADMDCVDPIERNFLSGVPELTPDEYIESLAEKYCSLHALTNKGDTPWHLPNNVLNQENPIAKDEYRYIEVELHKAAPFRTVIDNLNPFVCYEVNVEAYSEHPHLGRVFSRSSRSSTILTFDSTPSQSPQDVRVRWTGDNNTILEIIWKPPPTWSTNGFITGYSLRLLGPDRENIKVFHVGPRTTSYRVEGLQPKTNFTLHLAALTCHGEGVRSEAHPIIASYFLQLMGKNASAFATIPNPNRQSSGFGTKSSASVVNGNRGFGDASASNILEGDENGQPPYTVLDNSRNWSQQAWFIGCLIGLVIIWSVLCVIVLIMCRRHRRVKQRGSSRGACGPSELKPVGGLGDSEISGFLAKKPNGYMRKDASSKVGLLQANDVDQIPMSSAEYTTASGLINSECPPKIERVVDPVPYPIVCRGLSEHRRGGKVNGALDSPIGRYQTASRRPGGAGSTHMSALNMEDTGYEAPVLPNSNTGGALAGVDTGTKFTSTGSIFLATGRTPSSSSNDSSLHKGAGEARIDEEVCGLEVVEGGPNNNEKVDSTDHDALGDDALGVTPYASASLIEQLRNTRTNPSAANRQHGTRGRRLDAGGGRTHPFAEAIPPPPQYPPPPAPESPPPPGLVAGSGPLMNGTGGPTYQDDECHYAQSDLQRDDGDDQCLGSLQPHFMGLAHHQPHHRGSTTGAYVATANEEAMAMAAQCPTGAYMTVCNGVRYPQEYWMSPSGQPGVCVMPTMTSVPNNSGGLYMPHMLPNNGPLHHAGHVQPQMYLPAQAALPGLHPHFITNTLSNGDQCRILLNGPTSVLADDVILPPASSTLMNSHHLHHHQQHLQHSGGAIGQSEN